MGWDAADWKVIHPLMDAGRMPHLQRLVERGAMANLATLKPVLSPMLWTSIATGKRPYDHGILGFTEPTPDGGTVQPVSALSRKTKALWNILNQQGMTSHVVGWWPSHPVEPLRGAMVSNHFHTAVGPPEEPWPVVPHSVHPPELASALAPLRVNPMELGPEEILPFVPKAADVDQDADRRLASVMKTLAECVTVHNCATWLLANRAADFHAIYYDAIDHFCHGFMRYRAPRQSWVPERDFELYRHVVDTAYVFHDAMLGTLVELAGPDATIVLCSDHGFHPDHLRPRQIPHEPAGPAVEHRDHGVFLIAGPGIRKDAFLHGASLLDVTPTILAVYGLPVGEDMEGKPLVDAFEEPPAVETIPSWDEVPGDAARHPAEIATDPIAARQALDQLVALGYVEELGADRERAVRRTARELRYNLARAWMDAIATWRRASCSSTCTTRIPRSIATASSSRCASGPLRSRWRCGAWWSASRDSARRMRWRRARVFGGSPTNGVPGPGRSKPKRAEATPRRDRAIPATRARATKRSRPRWTRSCSTRRGERSGGASAASRRFARSISSTCSAGCVSPRGGRRKRSRTCRRRRRRSPRRPGLPIQIGEAYLRVATPRRRGSCLRVCDRDRPAETRRPDAAWPVRGSASVARASAAEEALEAVGLLFHYPLGARRAGRGSSRVRRRYGDAEAAFRTAISLNPNSLESHARLVRLYTGPCCDVERAEHHRRRVRALHLGTQTDHGEAVAKPRRAKAERAALAGSRPAPVASRARARPGSHDHRGVGPAAFGHLDDDADARGRGPRDRQRREARRGRRQSPWLLPVRGREEAPHRGRFPRRPPGRAIKIVAPLLPSLPSDHDYRVIFMERDLDEVLASQRKMLSRLATRPAAGEADRAGEAALKRAFARQLRQVKIWLGQRENLRTCLCAERALADPGATAARVTEFLRSTGPAGGPAPIPEVMAGIVDPGLYRQRNPLGG